MDLTPQDRRSIGEDIATLEFGWPVGQPKCAPIKGIAGLYEIRTNISSGRTARVFFVIVDGQMVLLHGFVKKAQKTPAVELERAVARMKEVQRYA